MKFTKMRKLIAIFLVAFLIFILAPKPLPFKYQTAEFKGFSYDYVELEPKQIDFFYTNAKGEKYQTIDNLRHELAAKGQTLLFATNGGIFSTEFAPMGLYIENGVQLSEPDFHEGYGNFYLKPNGIFSLKRGEKTLFALQSGPLLLKDFQIHPEFRQGSDNINIRSGVGINKSGKVFFAISNQPVNFYDFASFFKDHLKTPNALYLDGTISEMYIDGKRESTTQNFAVMLGVTK
jgi:uncharacterized protein YigE (DUF2233 family)